MTGRLKFEEGALYFLGNTGTLEVCLKRSFTVEGRVDTVESIRSSSQRLFGAWGKGGCILASPPFQVPSLARRFIGPQISTVALRACVALRSPRPGFEALF